MESISQYCKIDTSAFEHSGAFDAFLDIDSQLFIDPHLLGSTNIEEFLGSYSDISDHFGKILLLIRESKIVDDIFWKQAEKLLTFSEVKGLCIGYSNKSTSGKGIGKGLRKKILATSKAIIEAGVFNPKIFELMSLFEEGIGADRISDMVAGILKERFYQYSHRVFGEFDLTDIATREFKALGEKTYRIPINPFNEEPIILIPKAFLQSLPTAQTCGSIQNVEALNDEIRNHISKLVGDKWKEMVQQDEICLGKILKRKFDFKSTLIQYPYLLQQIIEEYSQKPEISYDFNTDPEDKFKFHSDARRYTSIYPLELLRPTSNKPEKVMSISLKICNHFKKLVENNGAYALFYSDQDKPRHERFSQLFFFCIADLYCQVNDLDLSPEVNSGRGCVDFKISSGYTSRVLVEMKLTTHNRLLKGYEDQLAEYQKAENTIYVIYLVIHVKGGNEKNFESLKSLSQQKSFQNKKRSLSQLKFVFVDAIPKASASHFRP